MSGDRSVDDRAAAFAFVTMTGASVIGCDTLEPDESPSCKPKKHHHKHKNHDDKDGGKDGGYGKSPWGKK